MKVGKKNLGQGGFASDSDEYMNPQQLPMIKGGVHKNNADPYVLNNTNYANNISP